MKCRRGKTLLHFFTFVCECIPMMHMQPQKNGKTVEKILNFRSSTGFDRTFGETIPVEKFVETVYKYSEDERFPLLWKPKTLLLFIVSGAFT